MFFFLSKALWLFVHPLNLAIFALFGALGLASFGRRKAAFLLTLGAALLLGSAAWTTLGDLLLEPLESRFARPDPPPAHVDGIILLGGALEGNVNHVRGGYEMNGGGDRFVEVTALARRYPDAPIVVSGGLDTVLRDTEGDADTAPRLFAALGIPRERLRLENRSRNTAENALFAKELIKPTPDQTWILVTSAYHMPRAVGLFRKAGFPVVPWPADYRTAGNEGFDILRDNETDALGKTVGALHEWIGLIAYWLTGKIDEPLPGPGSTASMPPAGPN